MRIAVVGASGRTGLHVVRHGQERADSLSAVVRNPDKFLRSWSGGDLPEVRTADARDVDALTQAFRGQDAVAFCLGQVGETSHTIHRDAILAVLGRCIRLEWTGSSR